MCLCVCASNGDYLYEKCIWYKEGTERKEDKLQDVKWKENLRQFQIAHIKI